MITNLPNNYMEQLQVVKYPENGYFNHHYDACTDTSDICEGMNKGKGPRLLTFIIYLNDDFISGDTDFPVLNIKIKPEKGKGVLFYNTDNQGNILKESIHAGLPVKNGYKWIANKWIHLH